MKEQTNYKMGKKNNYDCILRILQELKKKYPTYTLGQHISTSLSEYGDIWGMTDKEFLFALEKYQQELEFDTVPDKDLNTIIEEGKNLDTLFTKDEDGDETY